MIKGSLADGLRTLPSKRLTFSCSLLVILFLSLLSFHNSVIPYSTDSPPPPPPPPPPPQPDSQVTPSETIQETVQCPPAETVIIEQPAPSPPPAAPVVPSGYIGTCGNETHAAARKIWLETEARYSSLMDDKFTIVMPTYKRPEVLNTTLTHLFTEKIPSLHEVVILWNDITSVPPPDFVSPHGIPVRHHVPSNNSLNNRFMPLASYATQAIFHSDDDLWYEPSDLEFVFQTWRQLGRYRITGALPRCHSRDSSSNKLSYRQCGDGSDWYTLVLTGVAFTHISLMDFYSSPWTDTGVYAIPSAVRQHVDEVFNCEDLAMNFIASMLTCTGPLHVIGKEPYHNQEPPGGISKNPGHWAKRAECMNHFEKVMGYFPLVQQYGSVKRGLPHYR